MAALMDHREERSMKIKGESNRYVDAIPSADRAAIHSACAVNSGVRS